MDLRRSSADESGHIVSPSIASALVSAVLEWMLMFMIFVDASLAYLVTRFARSHRLREPCLLCSRLDHVLGNERAGFHWGLICHDHKSKISSLVHCQLHNNLVDVHAICESCFCSFDSINMSSFGTYRLPVSQLGSEPSHDDLALVESSDEHNVGLSSTRKCACCNEQWISRPSTRRIQERSIDNEGGDHDAPSSIKHTRSGDVVRKITEKSTPLEQIRSKDADPLPYVEYSQIKDTSDSESEGPLLDTESATVLIREMETSGRESVPKCVSAEPQVNSPAPEKLIHPDSPIKSLPFESERPSCSHNIAESEAPRGLGLEELNWQQAGGARDVHPSPNPDGTHSVDSKHTSDATIVIELEKEVHVESTETSNQEIDSTCTDESWKQVKTECQENSRIGSDSIPQNEIQMDLKPHKTETSLQTAGPLDLGDAYRLALGTRGRQLSGKLELQRSITDRVSEDLKLLLSQISAARGLDLPSADMSPKVSANTEDFRTVDAYSAIGMHVFQRRISLERNESNLSLDGSIVSEIEGESEVERLKRQVEHDKKMLGTLYKELEEERNASAIAANQAMAMITKLQEEKAAFHMEALQCVRMMEEQAEYDGEALQKASVLLAEKERQIQQFQFELDIYRNGFGDMPSSNNFVEPGPEYEADVLKEQILEANSGYNDSDINKYDIIKRVDGSPKMLDGDINTLQMSLRRFEDEKQCISECLKMLEEKLFIFNKSEVSSDITVQGFSTEEALEASSSGQSEFVGISEENGGTEKNHLKRDKLMPKDLSGYESSQLEKEEPGKFGQHVNKDVELAALRHELSVINSRLEALEVEQNVIECSINALEKGSEGLEFIQEIAARLHELHSAHIIKEKKTQHEGHMTTFI